ncbi:MAG: nickel-dependent lactate racemase [Negativicutes bacterium]|nr:nickel-dependent lactate racemase [Negativicutes bacterium]
MGEFKLGFGDGFLTVNLPAEQRVQVVQGRKARPVTDVPAAVRQAMRQPTGTPSLQEIVAAGDTVAVIVSDYTRSCHYERFLTLIFDELNIAGVPDENITMVVALGAHRRHSEAENVAVYGAEAVRRVRLVQSYACDEGDFDYVGTTSRGVAAHIHRQVVAADKVILTGGVCYHPMAGFAGGRKSLIPGVSSYCTIQANHRFCLHDEVGGGVNPGCGCGKLAGNPMHEDQMEIAAMVEPDFLLNAIVTPHGDFIRFVGGHWRTAWEEGCRLVAELYGVPIREKTDLVIASAGGFPKDINFYQGTKATENALAACKQDGVVIALLECRNIFDPPDFSQWFEITSLTERELALRNAFTVPGYVALKNGIDAARVKHIIVTLPENRAFIEKAGMAAATSWPEALALAEAWLGRSDYTVTVMPEAASTLPLLD